MLGMHSSACVSAYTALPLFCSQLSGSVYLSTYLTLCLYLSIYLSSYLSVSLSLFLSLDRIISLSLRTEDVVKSIAARGLLAAGPLSPGTAATAPAMLLAS